MYRVNFARKKKCEKRLGVQHSGGLLISTLPIGRLDVSRGKAAPYNIASIGIPKSGMVPYSTTIVLLPTSLLYYIIDTIPDGESLTTVTPRVPESPNFPAQFSGFQVTVM